MRSRALAPACHKISLWPIKQGHCKSASVPGYSLHDGTWLPLVFSHLTLMRHTFLANFGHDRNRTGICPFCQIYQNETPKSAFSTEGACRFGYALPSSHRPRTPLNSISYMGEGDLSREASEVDKFSGFGLGSGKG